MKLHSFVVIIVSDSDDILYTVRRGAVGLSAYARALPTPRHRLLECNL